MMPPIESATLDAWYAVARSEDVGAGGALHATRLLGTPIQVGRSGDGALFASADDGRALAVRDSYAHVWVSLGKPNAGLFALPQFDEPDRRVAACGAVRVRASGLRLVENFLDMAHFPFVHTDILGTVEEPEVLKYDVVVRDDEVWAENCRFFQPRAAANADGGILVDYTYRVATPFNVLLYKTCPSDPARMDVICLFIQPVEEDVSLAFAVCSVVDAASARTEIIHFQQTIFLQDRIILENQRPRLLPLSPRAEIPTRADLSSIAYRRWLKEKGVRYGSAERAA